MPEKRSCENVSFVFGMDRRELIVNSNELYLTFLYLRKICLNSFRKSIIIWRVNVLFQNVFWLLHIIVLNNVMQCYVFMQDYENGV